MDEVLLAYDAVLLGDFYCFDGTSGTNHPVTMRHITSDPNPSKTVLFNRSCTVNSYLYDMSA